jgi:hypothetical protein
VYDDNIEEGATAIAQEDSKIVEKKAEEITPQQMEELLIPKYSEAIKIGMDALDIMLQSQVEPTALEEQDTETVREDRDIERERREKREERREKREN